MKSLLKILLVGLPVFLVLAMAQEWDYFAESWFGSEQARLELGEEQRRAAGDAVYLTETPDGYRISPYDPEFVRQMELAEKGMKKYRNALRELAK